MKSSWSTMLRQAARILAARRGLDEDGEETVESGFTLIELMVVLLILGILLAIAIPTFLGATKGANDKAAQSNLTSAINAAKVVFAQHTKQIPAATMATDLNKAEPDLTFTSGTAAATKTTSISYAYTQTTQSLVLTSYSTGTKVCWIVTDDETSTSGTAGGVRYGWTAGAKGTTSYPGTTLAGCKASNFLVAGVPTIPATEGGPTKTWPTAPSGR